MAEKEERIRELEANLEECKSLNSALIAANRVREDVARRDTAREIADRLPQTCHCAGLIDEWYGLEDE